MIVLGIESSCDETACAIVNDERIILSNIVLSQLDEHRPYGGIVPEIAARAHLNYLDHLIIEALARSEIDLDQIDVIAATGGPGLIGGVLVGIVTAKAIAMVTEKPFVAVNHLEGHALSARLTNDLNFPYLLLLISGGHSQLLIVEGVGCYRCIGTTIDDAAGEVFDKTARMLNLSNIGGLAIQQIAEFGNSSRFFLPRPMKGRSGCDFSFSGLKNAVRLLIADHEPLSIKDCNDIAASFQFAMTETIVDRTKMAMIIFSKMYDEPRTLVIAGGVAANVQLRRTLANIAEQVGFRLIAPPFNLCTDNAAMIAWAGLEQFCLNKRNDMDFIPRSRWSLD
ncbi:MAG: tRNA (adenosine(37)-N6)-threonylcarbamoyltransferase complex transferase subunit TsaD [Rhodospirillaceae bacterium]|nr:tRNA (adenosine(37)-N6)-threonylcarbamoyltransferase complex transferase subunit TsaD [Rhodospirillaceae bacterium]